MLQQQPRFPVPRAPAVDVATLPRKRIRPLDQSNPPRPAAAIAAPAAPVLSTPTSLPAGTVVSRHVGRLATDPALQNLPAKVRKGQRVATVSALGMSHAVHAPFDGVVIEILTESGHPVQYGQPVLRMAAS